MTSAGDQTQVSQPVSRKRKRLVKHKKKNWRKTDIQDIEDHLEDRRLQDLTGGIAADKKNEDLFFVDTVATEDPPKSSIKRQRVRKPLKCFSALEPDPNIKPSRIKHNLRQNSIKKRCTAIQTKVEKGIISASEKEGLRQRTKAIKEKNERIAARKQLPTCSIDLWSSQEDDGVDKYYLRQTSQLRKLPPRSYTKKPSGVASVEIPHPGSSYNPTYDDHQDLLHKAWLVENQKEKEEQKLKRALDDAFPRASEAPTEESWIKEMSAGLATEDAEGDEDDPEATAAAADDRLSCNPPIRREDKKTKRQRRKEKEQREVKEKAAAIKHKNVKKNEIFRLKSIKAHVLKQEKALTERKQRKAALRKQSQNKTQKLGKKKFTDAELEIKLSSELTGSLRQLKPEGNIMDDRFKSYQKRNIIEPTTRAKKHREKAKFVVKKAHRIDT